MIASFISSFISDKRNTHLLNYPKTVYAYARHIGIAKILQSDWDAKIIPLDQECCCFVSNYFPRVKLSSSIISVRQTINVQVIKAIRG